MRRGKRPACQISDIEQRLIEILSTNPDLQARPVVRRAQIPRNPFQGAQTFNMKDAA